MVALRPTLLHGCSILGAGVASSGAARLAPARGQAELAYSCMHRTGRASVEVLWKRGLSMPGELALAFAAGVISFISPCCLPMVPMYLSYLAGIAGGTARTAVPVPAGASRSFALAAPGRW